MKKYFLQVFFILISNASYSQVVLSGHIQEDGSGERLSYSNVYIDEIKIGSSANENGFFTIIGEIEPGMILKASYVGYQTKSISLTQEIIDSNLEISLIPLTSTLNEVVVSTESSKFLQANTEISKHRMSVQQLSLMPSIGEVDIFRSLQLLPGISSTGDGSSGINVRGGSSNQNMILLDGMNIYHVDHYHLFSNTNIELFGQKLNLYKK